MREARREYVGAEDADYETSFVHTAPPAVVWQYFVDPFQRLRWEDPPFNKKNPDKEERNARGRSGVGAKSHCDHQAVVAAREIVDWRPFSYFTCRSMTQLKGGFIPARPAIETVEFVPHGDGSTLVCSRLRMVDRGRLSMLALKPGHLFVRRAARGWGAKLQAALEEDMAAASS